MQPLIAVVKATIRTVTLLNVIAQLNRFHRLVIFVTRYVTPQLAETLKENDILFIDTAGNAYLQGTNTFVYITGCKLTKTIRAFRAKGLKVIFTLLCRPEFVNAPYREIADKAGVALGTVTNVVKDFEQLGYLFRSNKKGLVLENKNKLIKLWAEAYPLELRPHLKPQNLQAQIFLCHIKLNRYNSW